MQSTNYILLPVQDTCALTEDEAIMALLEFVTRPDNQDEQRM